MPPFGVGLQCQDLSFESIGLNQLRDLFELFGMLILFAKLLVNHVFVQQKRLHHAACFVLRVFSNQVLGDPVDGVKRGSDQQQQYQSKKDSDFPFQAGFAKHFFDGTV